MGKHEGSYARVDKDRYQTPRWPVEAVCEHVDIRDKRLWEPFCGDGQMSDSLFELGAKQVYSTDIEDCGYRLFTSEYDFLSDLPLPVQMQHIDGIFSNPPYGEMGKIAERVIVKGLHLIKGSGRFMVLLLPADFDSASSRVALFDSCPAYLGKVRLRKRIKWFDRPVSCRPCNGTGKVAGAKCVKCGGKGEKKVGPKENHDWYIWQYPLLIGRQVQRLLYAPGAAA